MHLKKVNELWIFCTISQICLFYCTYIKDEVALIDCNALLSLFLVHHTRNNDQITNLLIYIYIYMHSCSLKWQSDIDHSQNSSSRSNMRGSMGGNNQTSSTHKPTASNNRQGLRRSLSQKDLMYHDGYSVSIVCLGKIC